MSGKTDALMLRSVSSDPPLPIAPFWRPGQRRDYAWALNRADHRLHLLDPALLGRMIPTYRSPATIKAVTSQNTDQLLKAIPAIVATTRAPLNAAIFNCVRAPKQLLLDLVAIREFVAGQPLHALHGPLNGHPEQFIALGAG